MDNRDRIIEGAAGLFRTFGIRSVTMDSIAAHLGISKRTIYEVFADKDELLRGVLCWMTEQQKDLLKRILKESENSIVAIFRLLEINRDHFQSMSPAFLADLKKYYFDALKNCEDCELPDYRNNLQIIENGIKEELFRNDINPELVNRCLYHLGRSIMDNELYPFDQFSRREVVRNIFINYLRGISTQKGLELINSLEKEF